MISPEGGADRPSSDGGRLPDVSLGGPLACVVTSTFLHFASLYFLLPTLPLYALSLGGTNAEVGLTIGILALTSLAARPFLGIWMDRAGRRGFLVAGAGIYVLASLGYRGRPARLACRPGHRPRDVQHGGRVSGR